jgi:hypothetical protein
MKTPKTPHELEKVVEAQIRLQEREQDLREVIRTEVDGVRQSMAAQQARRRLARVKQIPKKRRRQFFTLFSW